MFSYVSGKLAAKTPASAVIDCGGVGFYLAVTKQTFAALPEAGEPCKLFTYMAVREDAIELYGFATEEEFECFKMMRSVSGVGNKVALAVLSELTPAAFGAAVAGGNPAAITAAQGVGPKLAQRILLELKEKALAFAGGAETAAPAKQAKAPNKDAEDAVRALVVLGYSASESRDAVKKAAEAGGTVEDIVRNALKLLL